MTSAAFSFFYIWDNYRLYYRKVGGIHWLAVGKLRVTIMWRRK